MAYTAEEEDDKPFLFPSKHDQPDAPKFFSSNLLSSPLPTHSFFQNFVDLDGDQSVHIHPYLIKSSASSLSLCYPSLKVDSHVISQKFIVDLTISSSTQQTQPGSHSHHHVISSFSDLSVTLDFPSSNLTFYLVRGSPYVTLSIPHHTPLSITSFHKFSSFTFNDSFTKCTLKLDNRQTWLIYAYVPIKFSYTNDTVFFSKATASDDDDEVPVIVRIALLPDPSSEIEDVLDKYSTCYPVSGDASFAKPYCVEYKWEKRGFGDLLMLAHPLHLQLLSNDDGNVAVLQGFKYKSIDGDLVGVVGDSWSLKADHVPVTWHSIRGVNKHAFDETKSALSKDVAGLAPPDEVKTNEAYQNGKIIARAARLALIAEEVGIFELIPDVKKFLQEMIQQWLDGTCDGKSFQYDAKWGSVDIEAYSAGYFLYGIAVLAKIDPGWGFRYKPQAYSLMANFLNLGRGSNSNYTRLRCFDLYMLHSWVSDCRYFLEPGVKQDTTSEAVNIYYSSALMALAYGDIHLASIGSTLTSLEIHAAKMWWHVNDGDNLHAEDFAKENMLLDYICTEMRGTHPERGIEFGIQVVPLLPVTEFLFSNVPFVIDLVKWIRCQNSHEEWLEFEYALEGIYNREVALEKARSLKCFEAGNSLSNLLWWIHSRPDHCGKLTMS